MSIHGEIVIIESPYAGDIERNIAYARACLRDSLMRGEAPYASHLLYTQPGVLDDREPIERELGIFAGQSFHFVCARVAVYHDLGITDGMRSGINRAMSINKPVVYRRLL